MFIDGRSIHKNELIKTDICIIGAGAAGITLAREFSGRAVRVCLVESGDLKFREETQALYKGENIGQRYADLDVPRLRYFGGTTNHWAGYCHPLDEIDFEPRSWIPYSGWPIKKVHLDPYYKRAQEILKLAPDLYGGEYWIKRINLTYLHFDVSKVCNNVTQIRPTRFGREYHDDINNALNIYTYLNANVMSLETDSEGKEVKYVTVGTLGGNRFRIAARLFILACGGIENARLLLISNIVHKNGLGNQHDLVGRFFMEHPVFDAGMILLKNSGFKLQESFYRPHKIDETLMIQGQLSLTPQVLRKKRISNFKVYLLPYFGRRESEGERSLRTILKDFKHLHFSEHFVSHLARVISDIDEVAEEAYVKYFVEDRQRLIITRSIIEQVPNPDSRVTLSAEKDALGINRVKLDWRLTDMDRRGVHDALMVVASELGRMGLGRMKVDSGMDDWIFPDKPYWGNHHVGTTRMHEDPKKGVVDSKCRVHNLNNLYIAGSSVFPTSGCAPPTLTIVALALRLAEHLKQEFIQ